jgi:hypothetical protein
MAVREKAGSGYDEDEQEAGGGNSVAVEAVATAFAEAAGKSVPGRLSVIEDLVQSGIGPVKQAAPL